MWPAPRQPRILTAAFAMAALLAGCGQQGDENPRPPAKPAEVSASVVSSGGAPLSRARISTKTGEILILEPDGSVSTMALDSAGGQNAFAVTEADLTALNANLDLNLAGVALPARRVGPTAQELAIEAFAARTQPALPVWREGTEVQPEDFIGTRIAVLNESGAGDLVEVTANLRRGVDADIAFAYATCALAGWAKQNGDRYGRHIRTLQETRNGKLLIGAAFTVSEKQPMGLRVMETNETLQECKARGIPAA
ncbi:hypothetical protein SAMN04489859_101852 [Paracoccus alcaliphilus]|uniref:Lipoprotein n=1 Tax=Paracoccus alcaliphilus TaxID=34002 RepID=A0A1H8JQL2_9RHOB|nr:hypothetical protein [Paracoccus alcaliphilus]SEN83034.1 hypothetical protein SAMN04489859_101852 [Paracoccus alcaliphilus]